MNQATPTHIRLPGVCCDGMNEPLDTREADLRLGKDWHHPRVHRSLADSVADR